MFKESALSKDHTFAFQWQTKHEASWVPPKTDEGNEVVADTINNKSSISKGKSQVVNHNGAEIEYHVYLLSEFPSHFCAATTHEYLNDYIIAFMDVIKVDQVVNRFYKTAVIDVQKSIQQISSKVQKGVQYKADNREVKSEVMSLLLNNSH